LGDAPPDRAKTPVMKSVRLKDSLIDMWLHDVKFFEKGTGMIPASPDI